MKKDTMMYRWIQLRQLLCGVMLIFTANAYACDPAGPPPPPWSAEQAAREMLQGENPEFTYVLYGTIAGEDKQSGDVYLVDVAHAFRGGLKGRLRASIGTTSCHGIRPQAGLKVVLYGQDRGALEIAGSMYGDLVPQSEVLYPALLKHEKQQQKQKEQKQRLAVELKPWWKFW
jgi:hypothetical protein